VTVEFKTVPECPGGCQQQFVQSGADGSYSIDLVPGTYNALCIVENPDYQCGPRGGDGGPYPVNVPPDGQQLDFVVCPASDYPACLTS
jgi:hypothetical protein